MGVFLLLIIIGSFAAGALVSVVLSVSAVFLVRWSAKRVRRAWWFFGIVTAVIFPCVILFVNARPATIQLPDSIDAKNLILNCLAYGASLGVAAAAGSVVSFIAASLSRSPGGVSTQAQPPPPPLVQAK